MDRKNVLYIAVSLDGMIAREDGSIDWLEEFEGEGDNGYSDFYQTVDTVILGRSTYEHVKVLTSVFPYQDKTCYVFTGSPDSYQDEHVTFINEGARVFTDRLKQEKGLNIWIAGGAELVNAFMKEDAIDEFIITVIPVVLGSGIPLFQELTNETKLRLKGMKQFGQAVQLHYVRS
ncbi:dihydrofolate reductase family protein [Bacillus stercoris]|uniref:dihydrofolate reductase family protein n=1 Tax=Bacillus stercoris TaxID=2054641 RepID=UPI00257471DE|nr:dihydrofolate reductase family protein [Bacillus stercoris]MDL9993665.1 dihydrofolate reductase family protein [Bacillus stercoris]